MPWCALNEWGTCMGFLYLQNRAGIGYSIVEVSLHKKSIFCKKNIPIHIVLKNLRRHWRIVIL